MGFLFPFWLASSAKPKPQVTTTPEYLPLRYERAKQISATKNSHKPRGQQQLGQKKSEGVWGVPWLTQQKETQDSMSEEKGVGGNPLLCIWLDILGLTASRENENENK